MLVTKGYTTKSLARLSPGVKDDGSNRAYFHNIQSLMTVNLYLSIPASFNGDLCQEGGTQDLTYGIKCSLLDVPALCQRYFIIIIGVCQRLWLSASG